MPLCPEHAIIEVQYGDVENQIEVEMVVSPTINLTIRDDKLEAELRL